MKKILFLIGALALMVSVSCLPESGGGRSSSAKFNGTWTVVNTESDETAVQKEDVTIVVEILDASNKLMNITFNNISFAPGMPKITMTVSDIAFTPTIAEDGKSQNFVFEQEGVVPTEGNTPYENYRIRSLRGYVGTNVEIELEFENVPYLAIFSTKKSGSSSAQFKGTWTATNTDSNTVTFQKENVTIDVVIPDVTKSSMNITFNGVAFVPQMPEIAMTVSDIAFTTTIAEDGKSQNFVFEQEGVVPTVGNTPYENYKIKVFRGEIGKQVNIELELESITYTATFTTQN